MVSNKIIHGENLSHYTARLTRNAIKRTGTAWTILAAFTLLYTSGFAVWVLEDGEKKKKENESGDQQEEEEEREGRRRKEMRRRSHLLQSCSRK